MKPIHILLVEDNEGDIFLTMEALQDSKIASKVSVIRDGAAAIDFFASAVDKNEIPDLVLLDINLPKKSGHHVLHYIKTSEKYSKIPVIMLTTSSSEKDIESAYKNYANCYVTKPIEMVEFLATIGKLEDFWANVVSMPHS
jgi:DNA-binding response OmpR family regulator